MNPILREFPSKFLTERLIIRMPHPGDGQAVFAATMASINELKPWLPFANEEQTVTDVEINVRKAHIAFLERKDLRLHIFLRETGDFIGSSGLHRIDWSIPKFEIGYWIDSRFSGKGYMTEAVKGITRFACQEFGAKRIEIKCDGLNLQSRAIPEKLGFVLEAILKNDDIAPDTQALRDTYIYAKTIL